MKPTAATIKLALKIADSCARSDVECHCKPTVKGPPWGWNLNSASKEDREHIAEAMEYLESRGLVKRDPKAPHIVFFPDAAPA